MAVSRKIDDIAKDVKAQIDTIPAGAAGIVHDRARSAFTPVDFKSQTEDTDGKTRVWYITVASTPETEDDAGFLFFVPRHVTIDGYFGPFSDPTTLEKDFRDLIDLVMDKIRSNDVIFGTGHIITPRDVLVSPVDHAELNNILHYHVLIEFDVEAQDTVC